MEMGRRGHIGRMELRALDFVGACSGKARSKVTEHAWLEIAHTLRLTKRELQVTASCWKTTWGEEGSFALSGLEVFLEW